MMNQRTQHTRRHFFGKSATGIGLAALAGLMHSDRSAAADDLETQQGQFPNFAPKANRVIYLYMAGGPSQFETFDNKPELQKLSGKPLPESMLQGVKLAFLQHEKIKCFGTNPNFKRCGQSGQEIAEVMPHLQTVADDLCIVRTLETEQVNHDPAHTFMNTGTAITGRPSIGSWLSYGLGSETKDLPSFVVMRSGPEGQPIPTTAWHNGFLAGRHQGVELYSSAEPLNHISTPKGIPREGQNASIDVINRLNAIHDQKVQDPEIATRISQYEMAFKMQTSVPDLADFSSESVETHELYGASSPDGSFGANCLMARRMAERGVRFIQLYHTGWDHHGGVVNGVKTRMGEVDQGCAALIKDLKQRGMLNDTLVIWGGEFGRTPMSQGGSGRDHHTKSGAMWLAGGGVKPGITYGTTDPLGFETESDPFHVHDFHATLLHLLGIEHKRLTFRYQGRDFRLTDVHGNVIEKILA